MNNMIINNKDNVVPLPSTFIEISTENTKTKKQKHAENQKKYREKKKLNPTYMTKKKEDDRRRSKKYLANKKNKQFIIKNNCEQFQSVLNEINNFDNIQTIPIHEIIFIDDIVAMESEYWVWTVNNYNDCMLLSAKDYFNKFSIN